MSPLPLFSAGIQGRGPMSRVSSVGTLQPRPVDEDPLSPLSFTQSPKGLNIAPSP